MLIFRLFSFVLCLFKQPIETQIIARMLTTSPVTSPPITAGISRSTVSGLLLGSVVGKVEDELGVLVVVLAGVTADTGGVSSSMVSGLLLGSVVGTVEDELGVLVVVLAGVTAGAIILHYVYAKLVPTHHYTLLRLFLPVSTLR